jgi:serine/threonine-protein kinase
MAADPTWEREATCVAQSWLQLVDDERHPASWAAAAPLLREEIGPREWDAALRTVRAPLGRCLWRKLRSRAVVEGPPGALRGPYVVIRFDSEFERGGSAGETITPVLGPDGRWRVAAYFIA